MATKTFDREFENIRTIAFYLPQYHPIPENDQWWGKGFTEWTNVTKAKPVFTGHYQPHFPSDLGYYDLRVRETRHEQIALAKANGIDGFCYHYYWFSGKRLLERPVDDMLADPESDIPFCLCWANENWTRRWDGHENEILIAQEYQPEDDLEFIKSIEPYFRDPRYITINGAPILIVYCPQHLKNARKSVQVWREYCASVGIPKIHLTCALTHRNWDYASFGFDSGVEFPPHGINVPNLSAKVDLHDDFQGLCVDFSAIAEQYLGHNYGPENNVYRSVFPSWDNTARRKENAMVVMNGTPENYEFWLSRALRQTTQDFPGQERLVFVNAWNEWAEGCHLEPDREYGHAFLEATQAALRGSNMTRWTHVGIPEKSRRNKSTKGSAKRLPYGAHKSLPKRAFRLLRDTVSGRLFKEWLAEVRTK
ncbi:glycoside hydrolase family 99-like domain-containing protein [Ruegeria sp. HKCCA6837]|uniref:glycosyltransferase WbsX family protein n=1 Tax=Ruegeria sp. HKCCA6837 TaxID=2682989 RepID=UPI0014883341|nr:glycoside hydrolase family 99-like domain-containing protein [Ruegeria sp. HKCCA6837]